MGNQGYSVMFLWVEPLYQSSRNTGDRGYRPTCIDQVAQQVDGTIINFYSGLSDWDLGFRWAWRSVVAQDDLGLVTADQGHSSSSWATRDPQWMTSGLQAHLECRSMFPCPEHMVSDARGWIFDFWPADPATLTTHEDDLGPGSRVRVVECSAHYNEW